MRLTTSVSSTTVIEAFRRKAGPGLPERLMHLPRELPEAVAVEVVGTVEDRGEEGLLVHVETVDGCTPSRWEGQLVRDAAAALEAAFERTAKTEAA